MKIPIYLIIMMLSASASFSKNVSENQGLKILAQFSDEKSFKFEVENHSCNEFWIVGALESKSWNKPQVFWLEAIDETGKTVPSKLPSGFGMRQLEFPRESPWANVDKKTTALSEIKAQPHKPTAAELLYKFNYSGVYSGPGPRDNTVLRSQPNVKSHPLDVNLKEWFDFETNKTYSVKVKLQPTKDSPVFESNPVIVKLSDESQKKTNCPR